MIDPTEDLLHRGLLPRLDHRVNGMTADRLPAEVVAHAAAETAEWAAYVLDACARAVARTDRRPTVHRAGPGGMATTRSHWSPVRLPRRRWSSRPRVTGPQSPSNPCPICWAVPITATPTPLGPQNRDPGPGIGQCSLPWQAVRGVVRYVGRHIR